MKEQFVLRLTLEAPHGKSYSACVPIDAFEASERYVGIAPPSEFDITMQTMDQVVERIRKREYRKEDFERAATQLAKKLGERMEDEEGWHGISRQERYEQDRREGRW